jgi:hypothetical protein
MMSCRFLTTAFIIGIVMSTAIASDQVAQRLQGPDFVVGTVSNWKIDSGGFAKLSLSDGSNWTISLNDPHLQYSRDVVDLAQKTKKPLFISGNRNFSQVERITLLKLLRPMAVTREAADDRLTVAFFMSPSAYYLWNDRPWFTTAKALLERTISEANSGELSSQLLVAVDVATLEVLDVRRP